jgi:hypothetical protein
VIGFPSWVPACHGDWLPVSVVSLRALTSFPIRLRTCARWLASRQAFRPARGDRLPVSTEAGKGAKKVSARGQMTGGVERDEK